MRSYRATIAALFVITATGLAQSADPALDAMQRAEARRYASLLRASSTQAVAPRPIDVKYYGLNVRVADQVNFLSGDVTALALVLDSTLAGITYDLTQSMTVDSVFINGARSLMSRSASTVSIIPSSPWHKGDLITTRVYYHGNPIHSGLGSYTDGVDSAGNRWIYTLSEPYGARDWWPCIDHPNEKADSADIRITCRAPLIAVTNGLRAQTLSNPDGTTTFVWKERYPIATYLISLNVGAFSSFSLWYPYTATDSMEIVNYVLPKLDQIYPPYRTNIALTPRMMQIYASIFGQYPFIKEKYGHVEFGWGGGMEHQTLTSIGPTSFSEATIAHELAHQWFGDMITCRSWGDLWLNEGFAQYFQAVYQERQYGAASYAALMASRVSDAKRSSGTLFVQDTTDVGNLFSSSRVYNKGSWVLHMLRHAVGDSLFFASIRSYANDPALRFGTAATADLRRNFEQTTGRDLSWFFNEWVFGERYPQYTYTLSLTPDGSSYSASVRIQQKTGTSNPAYFTMPVDLKFTASGWDTTVTVFNSAADQIIQIPLSHKPVGMQFDPQSWILCDVTGSIAAVTSGARSALTYALFQNYPNPFNPSTVIRYSVPERSRVVIAVYDIVGREVASLVNAELQPGEYSLALDGSRYASGVYLCRMSATGARTAFSSTRRLLLVR